MRLLHGSIIGSIIMMINKISIIMMINKMKSLKKIHTL